MGVRHIRVKSKDGYKLALVNAEHYPTLIIHRWRLQSCGYAVTVIGTKHTYMHELLITKKPSEVIDHINFNKLDNRVENLRALSNNKNLLRSKYRDRSDVGVSYFTLSDKWRARAVINGKDIHIGLFRTKKDAIKARDSYMKGGNT